MLGEMSAQAAALVLHAAPAASSGVSTWLHGRWTAASSWGSQRGAQICSDAAVCLQWWHTRGTEVQTVLLSRCKKTCIASEGHIRLRACQSSLMCTDTLAVSARVSLQLSAAPLYIVLWHPIELARALIQFVCDGSCDQGQLHTVSMHQVKPSCRSAQLQFLAFERAHVPDLTSTYLHKNLMQLERLVACLLWLLPCTYVVMEAAALTAFPSAVRR
jgi:hypothetical protein